VLGSNLSRDISYPDGGIPCFSSVTPAKCQDSISIRPRPLVCLDNFSALFSVL
jgi:hypothetical protein